MTRSPDSRNHLPDQNRSRLRFTVLALLTIVVVTAALRVPLLDIPFERDEGEYAYIGWRLGFGELPYHDWFDQKPPAIFWVYRLALSLPLDPVRAVHLVGMVFAAGSACCLYLIARRFLGHPWGVVSALLFALISVDPLIQGTAANTELFMSLPLLLSHVLYLQETTDGRGGKVLPVLLGIANGIAIACKQVALVNWLFMIVAYPMLTGKESRARRSLSFALHSALGMALFWGGIALFFHAHDALDDFVFNVFTHNFDYIQTIPYAQRWSFFVDTVSTLARSQLLVWLVAAIGLATTWSRQGTWLLVYLAGWAVASMVGVSASGYYFPHYFQQMLPPLVLCAALGARWLYSLGRGDRVPVSAKRVLCTAVLAGLPCVTLYPFLFHYTPAEAARSIYPGNPFGDMPAIGLNLEKVTKPDDRIYIFGAEPELLFYTRRLSATRYIFLFPLFGPYEDALAKQMQATEEIVAAKPEVILYVPNALFFMPGTEQYLTRWTKAYIEQHYDEYAYMTRNQEGVISLKVCMNGEPPPIPEGDEVAGVILRTRKV